MNVLMRITALLAFPLIAACSGSGCGSCIVPPYNSAPSPKPTPNTTQTPTPIIPQPSMSPVIPIPTSTPTLPPSTPTPMPTPTPTPVPVINTASCQQGGPQTIPLGSALAPFAILASTTVTNVGNTNVGFATGAVTNGVNDDLIGVYPGTAVTGFYPPGTNTDGTQAIYAAGFNPNRTTPQNAQNALTVAYNTAAGRPSTATFPGGTDLSQASIPGYPIGTLPSGVYKSATTLSIASGNLTLDGGGNPQAVFIFQIGTGFTTTANSNISGNINLINGASACNIYWQIGTSATLGGSTFDGNVLAGTSVTINARNFTGRALAQNGAVSIPLSGGSLIVNPGGQ